MQPNNPFTNDFVEVTPSVVGICGSDLQKIDTTSTEAAFRAIGHEIVATYQDGLAVVNPLIVCGQCEQCNAGKTVFCRQLLVLGRNQTGGFSGSISVPVGNIHPITLRKPAVGVLADPYAVILHGLGEAAPAGRIAIVGDGILAQLTLLFYILHPEMCRELCMVTKSPARAKKLEQRYEDSLSDTAILMRFVSFAETAEWSDSFELVIETVGRTQSDALNRAIALVTPRGNIISFGVYSVGYTANLQIRSLLYKEATMRGSNSFEPTDFSEAVSQLESHENIFTKVLGASYEAANWKEAVADASRKPTDTPQKVTINFIPHINSLAQPIKLEGDQYVLGK